MTDTIELTEATLEAALMKGMADGTIKPWPRVNKPQIQSIPEKKDTIESLYANLPKIHCKGLCHASCGPIPMSAAEDIKISELYPHLDMGTESLLARARNGEFKCSALTKDNRCSIYKDRPLVCRLYGVVKKMACPYGCKPSRFMPEAKSRDLINRMDKIE